MAIAVLFDGTDMPREMYDRVLAAGGRAVAEQAGRSIHVAYRSGTGFGVVDVWESEEALGQFAETVLLPTFAEVGLELPPPQVYPLHNTMGAHPGTRNVATVQAVYEAFGRGDIPFILEQLADDVDWESGGQDHGIPWLIPGRGVAHVASFFESLRAIDVKRFEPFSIVADGDRVIALINLEAVVLETGRTVSDLEVHVWTFRDDGKVTSLRHVVDTIAHRAGLER